MREARAKPVIMKVHVATIDLMANLGMPQTPCPLVHPLPIRTPTPTNSPPMNQAAMCVYFIANSFVSNIGK